ncbi:hypothetical protein ALC57_04174 [Trachymyrmex cornetzi]|uniref:Uncharacterized protein n=1 Tax=Trachymyrmex cornetzi TaxID=471704 RepID=A0A195EDW7_9HYME|nr:hypothetical protein ALC57_04174 [Trachymyrmex cornetzi]
MAMAVDHRLGVGGGRRSAAAGTGMGRRGARIEGGAQEGNARWERGKKRTATCRMMKAVPVPDLCAIFTLVLMLHARREYLRPRDSGRARSPSVPLRCVRVVRTNSGFRARPKHFS